MLRVSISAPNKCRPFLPQLCHSSPLLGEVDDPSVRGLQRCIIVPWELGIWYAGVAAPVCAGDMLCHFLPLLAHKYSPQQQGFQKAFAHHLQKTLLWDLHAGLALKLTSPSTCWMDTCLFFLKAQSTLWSWIASLQAAGSHRPHGCFFLMKQVPWHSSRSSQKSLAIPGVHRLYTSRALKMLSNLLCLIPASVSSVYLVISVSLAVFFPLKIDEEKRRYPFLYLI